MSRITMALRKEVISRHFHETRWMMPLKSNFFYYHSFEGVEENKGKPENDIEAHHNSGFVRFSRGGKSLENIPN